MCGIAGFSLAPGERVDSVLLTRTLLAGIDPRGGDATGAAWTDRNGAVHHITVQGRAHVFSKHHPGAATGASTAILHTRFATQGDPSRALNNHPVRSGHFLAVHNGHIYNDTELFTQLPVKRLGEVDSEAVVALVRYANMKGENAWEALERLEGRAAVAWLDDRDPATLHVARGDSSPLEVVVTVGGSVLFASTRHTLDVALRTTGLVSAYGVSLSEGTYMRFVQGTLVQVQTFTPNPGRVYTTGKSAFADQGGSTVIGKPATGKSKSRKGKRTTTARAYTPASRTSGTLVPYSDDVYRSAWDYVDDGTSSRRGGIHSVPLSSDVDDWDDWSWDDGDLLHVALKSLPDKGGVMR